MLFAETIGLSTCWIAGSYQKKRAKKAFEADGKAIDAVEGLGCTVVEQFYIDAPLSFEGAQDGTQARVFPNRGEHNQAVYAQGRAPEADDEHARRGEAREGGVADEAARAVGRFGVH